MCSQVLTTTASNPLPSSKSLRKSVKVRASLCLAAAVVDGVSVHVAHRGDVLGLGDLVHVAAAAAAAADDGDVDLAVQVAAADVGRGAGEEPGRGGCLEEGAAGDRSGHGEAPGEGGVTIV